MRRLKAVACSTGKSGTATPIVTSSTSSRSYIHSYRYPQARAQTSIYFTQPELLSQYETGRATAPFNSTTISFQTTLPPLNASTGGGGSPHNNPNSDPDKIKREAEKKANLGELTSLLKSSIIPNMLTSGIPERFISPHIRLRILPVQYPNWPAIHGMLIYNAVIKGLQILLTSLYVNPKTKLHINHIKVIEGGSQQSERFENGLIPQTSRRDQLEEVSDSTWIIVKFWTCAEGCEHLRQNNGDANNAHNSKPEESKAGRKDEIDFYLSNLHNMNLSSLAQTNNHILESINAITPQKLMNLVNGEIKRHHNASNKENGKGRNPNKENLKEDRIISGVFKFELNSDNSQIIYHIIDNVEIIDNKNENLNQEKGNNQASFC